MPPSGPELNESQIRLDPLDACLFPSPLTQMGALSLPLPCLFILPAAVLSQAPSLLLDPNVPSYFADSFSRRPCKAPLSERNVCIFSRVYPYLTSACAHLLLGPPPCPRTLAHGFPVHSALPHSAPTPATIPDHSPYTLTSHLGYDSLCTCCFLSRESIPQIQTLLWLAHSGLHLSCHDECLSFSFCSWYIMYSLIHRIIMKTWLSAYHLPGAMLDRDMQW